MIRKLYNWTLLQAEKEQAIWILAAVSFLESSIFPIPPDILLIPMVLARPKQAFWIATVCMVSSVLGALVGYGVGYYGFDIVGQPLLSFYGYSGKFSEFQGTYNEWGAWAVLIAGLTPFPFKVITILSGATSLNLVTFVVASIIARSIRFYLVAGLLRIFGPPVKKFVEKHLSLVFLGAIIVFIGGFAMIHYVI